MLMNKSEITKLIRNEVEICNIKAESHRKAEIDCINNNKSTEADSRCAELHEYYSNKLRYISLALTLLK